MDIDFTQKPLILGYSILIYGTVNMNVRTKQGPWFTTIFGNFCDTAEFEKIMNNFEQFP